MTDKAPFSTRVAAVLSAKLAALRLAYHEVALPWLLPGNPPESAPEWAIFGYFTGGIGERIIAIMLAQQFMRRGIHCKFLVAGVGVDRLLVADDPLSGALNGISQTECALLKPGAEAIHWEKDYSEARFFADGVDMHELVYSTVARKHALTRDKLTDPAWRPPTPCCARPNELRRRPTAGSASSTCAMRDTRCQTRPWHTISTVRDVGARSTSSTSAPATPIISAFTATTRAPRFRR